MLDKRHGHHHEWHTVETGKENGSKVRECTQEGCKVRDILDKDNVVIQAFDRRKKATI